MSDKEKPHIEVVSDESWKDQVKANDAKLDAELEATKRQSTDSGAATQTDAEAALGELPPASFNMLVQMFYTQAIVALGLIPGPSGDITQELTLAKHFIDLLAVLEKKTMGNLEVQEEKLIDNALHELRMAYLQMSNKLPDLTPPKPN